MREESCWRKAALRLGALKRERPSFQLCGNFTRRRRNKCFAHTLLPKSVEEWRKFFWREKVVPK
jgi:hypothetical protein